MADEQVTQPAFDAPEGGLDAFKAAVAAHAEGKVKDDGTVIVDDKAKVIDEPVDDKSGVIENDDDEPVDDAAVAAKAAAEAKAKADAAAAKNKGKSVSQRIAEFRRNLTNAQEAAEIEAAEAERLRIENETLKAQLAGKKPDDSKTPKVYVPEEGEPKAEDYEFGVIDPAYVRDLTDFKVSKVLTDQKKTQQFDAEKKATLDKFEGTVKRGLDKYDDYLQVVVQGADEGAYKLSPTAAQTILDSDLGHEIAYHLAKNPDEAADLFALPPLRQAAAIGRLEARFAAEAQSNDAGNGNDDDGNDDDGNDDGAQQQQPAPKNVTAAPAPPARRDRSPAGEFTARPDTKDLNSYRRQVEKLQSRK